MTWREVITQQMLTYSDETWSDVESCTLTDAELDAPFEIKPNGCQVGLPFYLWTKNRVYFPMSDDFGASDFCFSVPRHPNVHGNH